MRVQPPSQRLTDELELAPEDFEIDNFRDAETSIKEDNAEELAEALEGYERPSMMVIQLKMTLSREKQSSMKRDVAERQDEYVKRKLAEAQEEVRHRMRRCCVLQRDARAGCAV